ncbi:S8 family serine peptidase [Kribbella shirazensis]|uniref:Subtilisin family serine protease n=1 Tax=Kribbella shirazensis TaxID=1105143 RepID=A0A7X5VGX7_9ACTN|nr:S8 family serine peptidase [Kribbella shirazensis]NIK60869.1 subtilisin family serine protease [Kribbella shirazensis]
MTLTTLPAHRRKMRLAAVLAAVLGLATATVTALPGAVAQPGDSARAGAGAAHPHPKSDKYLGDLDRSRIAAAQAAGKKTVTLLVAAERDRLAAAADQLRALGGVVLKTDSAVDYLKVEIPTGKAEQAARLSAVEAVDVDGLIPRDDPQPQGAQSPIPQTPPSATTPRINPYLPTGDTQAAQFGLANPAWDGRGTTIAILDSGIDLDVPALKTTTTGLPKIVDWYNANSPASGDATWISTAGRFTGTFTAVSRTWIAPATGGPYAFGLLREAAGELAQGELGGDVDRDGVTAESIGVLQDRTTKQVYVDIDQDGDFTDQTPMIDFKVNRDTGHLGTDNPATAVNESVPFVVVTDRSVYNPAVDAGSVVNLGIAGAQHGTHVAGITAANGLFGGQMSGAAPGAQLMAVKVCLTTTSCTSSGLIDGVLYAANNGADVVNISIGGLPGLNDGNNARAVLYNRTIDEFNMQIFISAGNSGAGANSVGDPSVATNSISVGSYITRETWLANYGSDPLNSKGLHPFSSRGPREDGGFKPDIVAPGAAISTTPLWQGGGPVPGTYTLPPGYSMLNGTSMAAPQAAGAGALLVSAYKATFGSRPAAAALRSAIRSSAAYQSQLGAYEQGAGLFQVTSAWTQLRAGQRPNAITAAVPVNTVLSDQLATPNVGVGIHDREGVVRGVKYSRTYTLTRTSGPAKSIPHVVRWIGNDGTFASRDKVNLPLNIPVDLAVRVDPSSPGAHSAVLQLDDLTTPGVDLMTMNAVFVPNDLTAANAYSFQASGTVGRNATRHYFVRVPVGASALKVDMTGGGDQAGAGQIRFLRYTPQGLPLDSTSSLSCYDPDSGGGCANGTPHSRTVVNPQPGVWELVVEARRTSDVLDAPFGLTATVLGTVISPNPDIVAAATLGTPLVRSYTVSNQFAGFTGRLVGGGALASTQTQRPTVGHLQSQTFDVTLPAGVTSYTIRTGNASDLRADIDLVVFRCTPTCAPVGASGGATAVEQVTLANPVAGLYRIQVDGFSVPNGTTEYDLVDSYVSPALGSLTSNDANASHPSGTSWSPTATLTVLDDPGAGRKLTGTLTVQTEAGVTVGTGSLVVETVT